MFRNGAKMHTPGELCAIFSVITGVQREPHYYYATATILCAAATAAAIYHTLNYMCLNVYIFHK